MLLLLASASSLMFGSIGDLPLESGKVLQDCRLGYRTFGSMNAGKSNIVLFPSWFNGTTEKLVRFIGPGGLVDSSRYFVIAVDALSNGVSTSPSNSRSQKGTKFPKITIGDMVEAERRLLTNVLRIDHVYAVMGVSMGGMQAFHWAVSNPDFMDKCISIVGTPKMGTKDMLLWMAVAEQMRLGRGQSTPQPLAGLLPAGGIASPEAQRQIGDVLRGGDSAAAADGGAAGALPLDQDPRNVWKQFEAMVAHDVSRAFGKSLDKAAARVKAKTLVIVATQDQAVSPDLPERFAGMIKAPVLKLTGSCGHKAYDCEKDKISPEIDKFLAR